MDKNLLKHIDIMANELSQNKSQYEQGARRQAQAFLLEHTAEPPLLLGCKLTDEQAKIPTFNTKEIHHETDKMLVTSMSAARTSMNGGREAVPSVRANMGCGIVCALFGLVQDLFDDKMPWLQQRLSKEQLSKMNISDLRVSAEFELALSHMRFAVKMLEGTGCRVFPLDIQGAFDVAHLVYGDDIFYDLYDDPPFIHHLMALSAEAVVMTFNACLSIIPDSENHVSHYNNLCIPRSLGGLKISEDTTTLLCAEHIEEFVAPYIHGVLKRCGGGYIHYCGDNPHLYKTVMREPLAHALNFGNPERHDMCTVLSDCAEAGKLYYGGFSGKVGETRIDFYKRILKSAYKDGRCYLLFAPSCALEERDALLEDWKTATEGIYSS